MEFLTAAMHFDDRLATVLRHRASGERAARTQFRQLLDLLGSKHKPREGERDESLLAAAWLRLGALGEVIPADERAKMIRDPGMRFRNAELAAHLAEDEPEVAAAALARADLDEDDWDALIPRLPVRARGFLRLRRDMPPGSVELLDRLGIHDRGLPHPEAQGSETGTAPEIVERVVEPSPANSSHPVPSNDVAETTPVNDIDIPVEEDTAIGALVKRIEAFSKERSATSNRPTDRHDAPRLPLGELADNDRPTPNSFAFTTDAQGRINWADRSVAPMVIGAVLDRNATATAIRFRQPIRSSQIALQGGPLIEGEWIMDASPRFTRPNGRFFGYAGMGRRETEVLTKEEQSPENAEADRLRQLLHELRTPVNAIQGFSEVIQQQLFGPAPHEYRALAAGIAGDSARMLAGFDEIDRMARLETGALDLDAGQSDFAAIVEQQIVQLQRVLDPKTASFEFSIKGGGHVPLSEQETEALTWRLLATLAGAIGAGEQIPVELAHHDGAMRLCSSLPASLAGESDIFSASTKASAGVVSAGMFGAGFAFRLARAEARAAGGDLTRVDDWLLLSLPLLTPIEAEPSQTGSEDAA